MRVLLRSYIICLTRTSIFGYPYKTEDIGEGMALVSQVIMRYWKPRFLLNRAIKCAYKFMNSNERFGQSHASVVLFFLTSRFLRIQAGLI